MAQYNPYDVLNGIGSVVCVGWGGVGTGGVNKASLKRRVTEIEGEKRNCQTPLLSPREIKCVSVC